MESGAYHQRFGRIDRLGSKNEQIQLVNFWPNMELNEYINLENRVKGKMVLLDISATGEENLIEMNENDEMTDLEYRRKQLEQLQSTVLDLEDIQGGITITDTNMNDFRMDIMEYEKNTLLIFRIFRWASIPWSKQTMKRYRPAPFSVCVALYNKKDKACLRLIIWFIWVKMEKRF